MKLHKASFLQNEWKEIEKDATYVFANKDNMEQHNSKMLSETSNSENPVANIVSKITKIGDTNKKPNWSHFDDNCVVKFTSLCIDAKVAIKGKKFCPRWGLYNGAIGTIKHIAFGEGKNPNNGDLPEYVVVEFNKLKLPKEVEDDCEEKVSICKLPCTLFVLCLIYHSLIRKLMSTITELD